MKKAPGSLKTAGGGFVYQSLTEGALEIDNGQLTIIRATGVFVLKMR